MRAITLSSWGATPTFSPSHPDPEPADSKVVVKVLASGLHSLVRMQTTGTHYSTQNAAMPYVPGADGVGTTPDGQTVFFNSIATGGAFAEYITVPAATVTPLPKGADAVKIAGLMNPGMSSWMAFKARTNPLPTKFTVLILGVTSLSGMVAVHLSRALGAGKVIGMARNAKGMATIDGLDGRIVLANDQAKTDFSSLGDIDLILDYLCGPVVGDLFSALKSSVPTQYVQIGVLAGQDMTLPGSLLRSKNITMRGTGPGAWTLPQLGKALPDLLAAVAKLPDLNLSTRKLEDVDAAWNARNERTVFVP